MKKLIVLFLIAALMVPVFCVNAADSKTETKTVDVKWNPGYVGSSQNTQNYVDKINPNGGNYSYTDLIDMGPAGSTVTFTNPGLGYPSKAAYVLSFWTDENTIDTSVKNYLGVGGSGTDAYKYSYTATDDCYVIVTYQCGQALADNFGVNRTALMVGDKEVDVEWEMGYVGSKTHKTQANKIYAGTLYAHNTVPFLLKKGETVSFVASGFQTNSSNAAIFSFWTLTDGADPTKIDSFTFADSIGANEVTAEVLAGQGCQIVTYTSTKDNEKIRLCYASGQQKDTPFEGTRPTVTLTQVVKEDPTVDPKPGDQDQGDATIWIAAISAIALAGAVICKKKRA